MGTDQSSTMTLYLSRHTGLDRSCRVKFNLRIGDGEEAVESGMRDEVSDSDGRSYGWLPRVKLSELVSKGSLRLIADLHSVNAVRTYVGIGYVGRVAMKQMHLVIKC